MAGVQVWLGRHIQADPGNPAWQELQSSHRNSPASTSDRDDLSGPRVLRSRQRTTLTAIIELPPGDSLCLPHPLLTHAAFINFSPHAIHSLIYSLGFYIYLFMQSCILYFMYHCVVQKPARSGKALPQRDVNLVMPT